MAPWAQEMSWRTFWVILVSYIFGAIAGTGLIILLWTW